ncbi:MAG: AraC family transcriptional regulator, partial [Tannerella sp.]|nr:AraC family transcriptional regulator [Tannerella sp.]
MAHSFANSIHSLKEAASSFDNYQDHVMIFEFDPSSSNRLKDFAPSNPSRFEAVLFLGISEGEMEIQIDYVKYRAYKNSLALIMPEHITYFVNGSPDLKGWGVAISKTFMETLSYTKQQQPIVISYMQLRKNPLTVFTSEEYRSICAGIDFVRNIICSQTHLFYKEKIDLALKMFFFDLGNIYLSKQEHFSAPTLSRKEELFTDFQTLLREHCKKQHDVKFYANKLCITTQYLSSILKEQTGKSASQWIQDALMIEAKGMLKTPRINIQQVANELNFPDQST